MEKIESYKNYLQNQLNKGVELIQRQFSNFPKGETETKNEERWITLSYDAGSNNRKQNQKYVCLEITGDFEEDIVWITYYLKISDNSRPLIWDCLEKFDSRLDLGIIAFDRWILNHLNFP